MRRGDLLAEFESAELRATLAEFRPASWKPLRGPAPQVAHRVAPIAGHVTARTADGFPGQARKGRVEEVPNSVTIRRLKPQDPSRPTDTRVLAVKVAFAEKTPLKLGTTVELRIAPPAPSVSR